MNLSVNFDKTTGIINPLNGICCAPYSIGMGKNQAQINHFLPEGNIPYCRLHDCCGGYGGTYFIDVTNIFPNFDADETKPENYDFHYSDEYITAVQNAGCEVYYRLGETIEWGSKKYRVNVPKDFNKWARICEHIIMHYNHGWANGFRYNIKYWEIWNEPENPGNDNGKCMWEGTKQEFFDLYEISSKYLKQKFPEILVGGYGGCGFYTLTKTNVPECFGDFITFFTDFLKMIKEKNCPLDFYSWHIYTSNVQELLIHAKFVRETLNANGFEKTESHLNEWNLGTEGTSFAGKHTMKGGSFLTAAMCGMQKEKTIDKAMYYCFSLQGMYNGFIDQNDHSTSPSWYPFAAFGKLFALKNEAEITEEVDGIYSLAATDGTQNLLLLTNYNSEEKTFTVQSNRKNAEIYFIDNNFKGFDTPVTKNDAITLTMPKETVVLIAYK